VSRRTPKETPRASQGRPRTPKVSPRTPKWYPQTPKWNSKCRPGQPRDKKPYPWVDRDEKRGPKRHQRKPKDTKKSQRDFQRTARRVSQWVAYPVRTPVAVLAWPCANSLQLLVCPSRLKAFCFGLAAFSHCSDWVQFVFYV